MDHIYENIEEYNPNKEHKILIVSDDRIADMHSNKKLQQIVTKLYIRGRKLNIFLEYCTILFCCTKEYCTKFYTLFYYENPKQTRASTNRM